LTLKPPFLGGWKKKTMFMGRGAVTRDRGVYAFVLPIPYVSEM
jgi:hypothetical protein